MTQHYNHETGLLLNKPSYPKTKVDYQPLLDAGDFDALEDLLMEHLDSTPQEIAFYIPAYRTFIRKKEHDRASATLGLHVESLRAENHLESEINLLQAVLDIWQDCDYARNELLDHLKKMYADTPNLERNIRHFKTVDTASANETLRLLELWLRYDEGRIVYMPSKGVARIGEANLKLGVIRMSFRNGEKMSLRIDEAERLCQSLTGDHFLARTITDRESLIRKAADNPGDLLGDLFASIKREVVLGELKEMLADIVPDAEWSGWWTKARKDSRLIVGSGKKPNLNWNESVSEGSAEILKEFAQTTLREKLEALKKHHSRSESLAGEMAHNLAEEAVKVLESEPALALEIVMSIADTPECTGVELPLSADELLSRPDAAALITGIANRQIRKKTVRLLADTRDDWPSVYTELLKTESDSSLLKLIYEALHNAGHDAILVPVIERTFSDASDNVLLYIWLCKELPGRPELQKYAHWDFIRSLFGILDDSALKKHHPALRALFDPGGVVDRAVETLDAATGRSLLDIMSRARGLEDYRKESVRQYLFRLFPELHEKKEEHLLATKESIERKRQEYEKLVKEDIPRNAREIQRTREYGDLRENFEYHEARRQQELLSSRAKTIHDDLISARAIEPGTVDTSKISIGSRCSLRSETEGGTTVTLTILGPWDSDPSQNILSYTSVAGAALLNAEKGSSVMFNEEKYIVDTIDVWDYSGQET